MISAGETRRGHCNKLGRWLISGANSPYFQAIFTPKSGASCFHLNELSSQKSSLESPYLLRESHFAHAQRYPEWLVYIFQDEKGPCRFAQSPRSILCSQTWNDGKATRLDEANGVTWYLSIPLKCRRASGGVTHGLEAPITLNPLFSSPSEGIC